MYENEQRIPEVIVAPLKTHSKWYKKGKKILGYSEFQNLGESAGILLEMKNSFVLEKIKFEVKKCTYDSVFVRINIWEFDEDSLLTGKSLLKTPLYQTIRKSMEKLEYDIDIKEPYIHDRTKMLVCLECVHSFGKGYIWFAANLGKGYAQDISLADWEKMPFNMGISLKTTSFKSR